MKTLKFLALFCFLAAFTACSSDDDNNDHDGPASMNTFTYNGKTYQLSTGILEKEDDGEYSDDGCTEFYLSLTTSELNEDDEGELFPSDDKFSIISFNLFSKEAGDIEPGVYHFNDNYNIEFTFNDGIALLDIEVDWDEVDPGTIDLDDPHVSWDAIVVIDSGEIEVHESGSTYDIDFEFTMNNNKKLKGNYTGPLLDESDYPDKPAKTNSLLNNIQKVFN